MLHLKCDIKETHDNAREGLDDTCGGYQRCLEMQKRKRRIAQVGKDRLAVDRRRQPSSYKLPDAPLSQRQSAFAKMARATAPRKRLAQLLASLAQPLRIDY
jgi:hypothetical protein